jgi:hypothetical protein
MRHLQDIPDGVDFREKLWDITDHLYYQDWVYFDVLEVVEDRVEMCASEWVRQFFLNRNGTWST